MVAPHTAERCSSPMSRLKHRLSLLNHEQAKGDGFSYLELCACSLAGTKPGTEDVTWRGIRVTTKSLSQTWNLSPPLGPTLHGPKGEAKIHTAGL